MNGPGVSFHSFILSFRKSLLFRYILCTQVYLILYSLPGHCLHRPPPSYISLLGDRTACWQLILGTPSKFFSALYETSRHLWLQDVGTSQNHVGNSPGLMSKCETLQNAKCLHKDKVILWDLLGQMHELGNWRQESQFQAYSSRWFFLCAHKERRVAMIIIAGSCDLRRDWERFHNVESQHNLWKLAKMSCLEV